MGGLVQQPPHPGAHRRHAAGRSRGTLLRYAGAARHGSMTQTKLPPKNPARFNHIDIIALDLPPTHRHSTRTGWDLRDRQFLLLAENFVMMPRAVGSGILLLFE